MAAHTTFDMIKLDKNYLSDFLLHRISALYDPAGSHVAQFFQYSSRRNSVEFKLFSHCACLANIKLHTCFWAENDIYVEWARVLCIVNINKDGRIFISARAESL